MIKVPYMEIPKYCDECPFSRVRYSLPLTERTHGYNCQIEFYEKGRYETLREGSYDEHIEPTLCPIAEANKENEEE